MCKTICGSTTPKIKVGTWFWILVSSVHPRVDYSWEMRKVGGGFNWGIGDSVNFSISCLTSLSRILKRREATFPSWSWQWPSTPSVWTAAFTKLSKEDGGKKRMENAHDTQLKCHREMPLRINVYLSKYLISVFVSVYSIVFLEFKSSVS